MTKIVQLVLKDFSRDWRNKSVLASICVYVLVSVFITYLSFEGVIDDSTWIALYWIIISFSLINISLLSFNDDAERHFYYLRSICSPLQIIVSKLLYSFFIAMVLGVLGSVAFMLFLGNIFEQSFQWYLLIVLGVFGLSNVFTLLSAISAKSKNLVLLAILGLPVIIPCILILISISKSLLVDIKLEGFYSAWWALGVLDLITVLLSLILFPYIWRE